MKERVITIDDVEGEKWIGASYTMVMGWNILAIGIVLCVLGLLMIFGVSLKWPLLPGDIYIHKDGMSFYFPIVSCILLSIVLSLIMRFFR